MITKSPKRLKRSRVPDLLAAVSQALEGVQARYAVGGAVAMAAHGAVRYTQDVNVFALDEDRRLVLSTLRLHGLRVVPVMEPFHYAAYLPDEPDPEVRIDVLFPAGEPELSAVEYPDRAEMDGYEFNVFSCELLVATKFFSDRDKDESDIRTMLMSGLFEPQTVSALIRSFDPIGAKQFDALIKRLRQPRKQLARRSAPGATNSKKRKR